MVILSFSLAVNQCGDLMIYKRACLKYGRSCVQASVGSNFNKTMKWVFVTSPLSKHATLRSKNRLAARNLDNVLEWRDMWTVVSVR